jgi:hypothetical protein
VREVHVLTVSSSVPMRLLDELLTHAEAVLHEHGASRVWVDPTQPGTSVVAEFPEGPVVYPMTSAAMPGLSPLV